MPSRRGWILSAFAVMAAASAICAASPADAKKTIRTDCFGDPLPDGAVARMGTVRFRHAGSVCFVGYLPDGKTMLSIGRDDAIRWWEAGSGKEIRGCAAGPSFFGWAWLSLDRTVLAAPVGGDVRIWDARSGKEMRKLEAPDAGLLGIALSADGKMLATCGETIRLWDTTTGAQIREFDRAADSFTNAAISQDEKTLISAGQDGVVRWWDVTSGKVTHEVKGRKGGGPLVELSADGKWLATYGTDNILRIWDAGSQKELHALPTADPAEQVYNLAFSPDGKFLAAGGEDGIIHLYDVVSGDERWRCKGHQEAILTLAFSPNGSTLGSGGADSAVRQWEVVSGKEIHAFAGPNGQVLALAVSPDGTTVASAGNDRCVHLWNPLTGEERRSLTGCDGEGITLLGFSPDGKTLSSASCSGRSAVHVWNTADAKSLCSFCPLDMGYAGPFVLSPDAMSVAAFDGPNRIALFDAAKGEIFREYAEPGRGSLQLGPFIEGGKTLAVLHHGGGPNSPMDAFLLWDLGTGMHALQSLRSDFGGAYACTASPDGKTLAVVGAEARMSLWNAATGDAIRGWVASKDYILATAFSADGRMVATSELDGSVSLWETATGLRRGLFRGGQGFIHGLAFSPDGQRFYSGGHDGTVLAWDLTSRTAASVGEPDEKTLERLWKDLSGGDAALAYRTVWRLAAIPERSTPFLSARLRHPVATPASIAQWIAELDSDDFDARERASAALRRAEELAEPSLRTAQAAHPSAEAGRRIEELLDWLKKVRKGIHPPEPQVVRAIEALEVMGTPGAREVLAQLGAGSETSVSREAKAALERLHQRQSAGSSPY